MQLGRGPHESHLASCSTSFKPILHGVQQSDNTTCLQGIFWIVHLQKACCGRRCKLWSKDGRGSTDSHEVKFLFMISACAASNVRISTWICNNVSFWLCEPTFLRSKLAEVSYVLKKQNSVEKILCIF